MLVREVMSSPVVAVRPDTSLKEASQVLETHSITAMPVIDSDGNLVGVVSEADVIRDSVLPDSRAHELPIRLTGDSRLSYVRDVMSTHALTVPPDADLSDAADLMTSTVVKSLPVVEGGAVVGVVSRRDIIRVIARSDQLMEAEIDDLIRRAGEDWTVQVTEGVVTVDGPTTETGQQLAQVLVCTVPGVVGVRFSQRRSLT